MSRIYNINNHLMEYKSNCMDSKGATPLPTGIVIGNYTWATTNLEYDDGGEGITIIDNVTSNGVNMGTQYYYTWEAAVRIASKIPGWHLPSLEEFNSLVSYCGGSTVAGGKLKSTTGWKNNGNGTNDYDFNGLPVGLYDKRLNALVSVGFYGLWRTSNESNNDSSTIFALVNYQNTSTITSYSKGDKISVRLVKD